MLTNAPICQTQFSHRPNSPSIYGDHYHSRLMRLRIVVFTDYIFMSKIAFNKSNSANPIRPCKFNKVRSCLKREFNHANAPQTVALLIVDVLQDLLTRKLCSTMAATRLPGNTGMQFEIDSCDTILHQVVLGKKLSKLTQEDQHIWLVMAGIFVQRKEREHIHSWK